MSNGFEDVIQCQSNLQKMHLCCQKQLRDLELKLENINHHHQAQIEGLKAEMQELRSQNQELKMQIQVIMEMIEQISK